MLLYLNDRLVNWYNPKKNKNRIKKRPVLNTRGLALSKASMSSKFEKFISLNWVTSIDYDNFFLMLLKMIAKTVPANKI